MNGLMDNYIYLKKSVYIYEYYFKILELYNFRPAKIHDLL